MSTAFRQISAVKRGWIHSHPQREPLPNRAVEFTRQYIGGADKDLLDVIRYFAGFGS
jgi:hypothetical protein